LSGRKRSRIWATSSESGQWRGSRLETAADFDKDGVHDVAALMLLDDRLEVVLLSGKDGRRLGAWSESSTDRGFTEFDVSSRKGGGWTIVAVATGTHSESKSVAKLSAFTFGREAPIWQHELTSIFGDVDLAICANRDVTADGVGDVLVGHRMAGFFSGRVDLVNGSTRKSEWSVEGTADSCFGYAIAAHPDMDGDSISDYLVTVTTPYNAENDGVVVALSGATGREIYRVMRSHGVGRQAR
jgi:hypothetical protein